MKLAFTKVSDRVTTPDRLTGVLNKESFAPPTMTKDAASLYNGIT